MKVDRNVFKNASAVGLPRAGGQVGIATAAALGVLCNPKLKLNLFVDASPTKVHIAQRLVREGKVRAQVDPVGNRMSIRAWVRVRGRKRAGDFGPACARGIGHRWVSPDTLRPEDKSGLIPARREGFAWILDSHTNVAEIRCDDTPLYALKKAGRTRQWTQALETLGDSTLGDMVSAVARMKPDELDMVAAGVAMNLRAALAGLRTPSGLGVGSALYRLLSKFKICGPLAAAQVLTAAASDARMSGMDVQVMSCAGSGNQGLVSSLPVVAAAGEAASLGETDCCRIRCRSPATRAATQAAMNADYGRLLALVEEDDCRRSSARLGRSAKALRVRLLRSVALSQLVTCYVTSHVGYLTPMCGCIVKAGSGAACGIAYFLGGGLCQIGGALKNVAGNVVGALCDGAKVGCALKLATAAATSFQCALLALGGVEIPAGNGIVAPSPEETIRNIATISKSMESTDETIVRIMEKGKIAESRKRRQL